MWISNLRLFDATDGCEFYVVIIYRSCTGVFWGCRCVCVRIAAAGLLLFE